MPHDLFGHDLPSVRIRAYPVRVRYGLVWIFPGDPARAAATPMPELPELEGPDPWAYVPLSFTWRAHHSMIIDNLCDLSHAHLHRRYPSFLPGRLLGVTADENRVRMEYEAKVGPLHPRAGSGSKILTIAYQYPYHRAQFEWSDGFSCLLGCPLDGPRKSSLWRRSGMNESSKTQGPNTKKAPNSKLQTLASAAESKFRIWGFGVHLQLELGILRTS